jgi:Protein of unknown function (DUF2442)
MRGMHTSPDELARPLAAHVDVSADVLTVRLADGRAISAPVSWYPRLASGTPAERARWQLLGSGEGIHWPDLDEDISIEALLGGQPSRESASSLGRWLAARKRDI